MRGWGAPPPTPAARIGGQPPFLPALGDASPRPHIPPSHPQAALAALVHRGPLTAPEVARFAPLPPPDARRALLVLLQHNLIAALPPAPPPATRGGVPNPGHRPRARFAARPAAFPALLRLPRCVMHARHVAGAPGAAVVAALAEHGRLRAGAVVGAAAARLREDRRAAGGRDGDGDDEGDARRALGALAAARLVERAPPAALAAAAPRARPKARAVPARAAPRRAPAVRDEDDDDGVEILANAYAEVRFEVGEAENEGGDSAPRKRGRAASPADAAADVKAAPAVLRINAAEFARVFRGEECVAAATARRGPAAGAVLAAALAAAADASPPAGGPGGDAAPASVSRDAVEAALDAAAHHGTLAAGGERAARADVDVGASLALLAADGCLALLPGGHCAPCWAAMLDRRRTAALEDALRARHGGGGARVFRLLAERKQLEAKAVAEAAMLPAKEGRALLYTLLRDGAVAVQDVPRGADRAPSRTLYTWRADAEAAVARLGASAAAAAGNAVARLVVEADRARVGEALALAADAARGAAAPPVSAARAAQLRTYSARRRMLWTRVLELERLITLLVAA